MSAAAIPMSVSITAMWTDWTAAMPIAIVARCAEIFEEPGVIMVFVGVGTLSVVP